MKRLIAFFLLVLVSPALIAGPMPFSFWKTAAATGASYALDFSGLSNQNPFSNAAWTTGPGLSENTEIFAGKMYKPSSGDPSIARVLESAATFASNQKMAVLFADGYYNMGPAVRIQSISNASCYAVTGFDGTTIRIYKVVDNGSTITPTQIGSDISYGGTLLGLELSASGTSTVTLTVIRAGSTIGTATDSSSPLTGGQPGVYIATQYKGLGSCSAVDL